ncbi:MAG TPA: Gfo/Idh/MocA family oxidoreductase [Gemmataceae bacterium]|nr:Gfo/Idh/MocA family oxidoreductase [Gemmataceae bacterium]
MPRLRMAVIGVGHLGKEHARILAGLPEVELVGVADVTFEQAQAVAGRLGCRAFGHHQPLLDLCDAAVLAVPTTQHYAVAREFLVRGIPLLVEKPLASSLDQAEQLVEIAQRQRVILQVGHIERFNPAVEELQRYRFQPKFVECERLGPFTGRSTDTGVVLDLMIHDLDLLLCLVQAPLRSVEALGVALFGGHEDIANARLHFANGCVANITASRASPSARRTMRIWSPEGYASVDFAKRQLTLIQPSEALRQLSRDPSKLNPVSRALLKDDLFGRYLQVRERDCNGGSDQLTAELKHFLQCIQNGTRPRVNGEDAWKAMALATQIIESIRSHRWEGHAAGATGASQLPAPQGTFFPPAAGNRAA